MVTLDVDSLDASIFQDRGLKALEYYLKDRTEDALPHSTFICDLAALVLKLNYNLYFSSIV